MRAQRVGTGPEFRLFQDGQEIGHVDSSTVTFLGFVTREDAALAASVADRALAQRRGKQHGSPQAVSTPAGVRPTLLPPAPEESEIRGWGFEIALLPEERVEVFATARARVIWRALQGTGVYRRMRQFANGLASV